jgi:hypothetical protein
MAEALRALMKTEKPPAAGKTALASMSAFPGHQHKLRPSVPGLEGIFM